MAVRDIRLYGDPVLRQPTEQIDHIDEHVRQLVQDLIDTVKLPGRAGVAAPQIGVSLAAFSYNVDGEVGYLLNPRIVELREPIVEIQEGCLSVPGLWFDTPRYSWVRAEGIDLDGNAVTLEGDGLMAQALQHEIDHLGGTVYLHRLQGETRRAAMREVRAQPWF
ncbi:peptide deformylase [Pseudoclavibacter sp. CFCC 11306]|uniref:peptide deformylase n=1 Tax=Pseudoclavibacter sp. CFCC 11306 TaxID=1564493 RepID=UPI0013018312|nr:peptide deformylase [Pseudoclavibacter sp. CFCC 11306]KAB1658180.1 peptide deformylase [Pseudoclavibacter sp. CFCC 11306]